MASMQPPRRLASIRGEDWFRCFWIATRGASDAAPFARRLVEIVCNPDWASKFAELIGPYPAYCLLSRCDYP